MEITRLTCALGAEISGVQLAEAIANDDLFGTLHAGLLEHKVLFARDQQLTPQQHSAFAGRFGSLEEHPVVKSSPEAPGIVQIYRSPGDTLPRYENAWHHDLSWAERPSMGAVLKCVECPQIGGDTMWANMELAWERLPERIKAEVEGLYARHSIEATFGSVMPIDKRHALHAQYPDAEHPVVRTHPETGRKSLFTGSFATHFTNFHTPERIRNGQDLNLGASQLLQYLITQAMTPEYQVRWRWTPGTVAIWDNRCTQHYAVMDYPPCNRKMERATISGDKPF